MKTVVETTIRNKYGFHARPSTSFSELAGRFAASVRVTADRMQVDGKSIMGLMSLGAPQGTVVVIEAEGPDADKAAEALKAHVDDRFGGIE